ncbi:MAG: amidohydrolase family protein [Euryarchaeota archaeon]|nr:amidohydrolase family protein [Euryarchaeota archaeon]
MRVFSNATLLCGEEFEVVKGYVAVENGVIKEIGEGRAPYRNVTDAKRGIIFPAFTNAHVHLGDSIARDLAAYEHIGRRVGRRGAKFEVLKKREVSKGIRCSLNEMLNLGTTAFCDFREGGMKGIKQLKSALLKNQDAVMLGRPNGDNIEEVLKNCDGIGISSVADYPPGELKKISSAVKKSGKLLALHAAEVGDDVNEALKLKPDFLVHVTNAGEESLQKIFDSKIPVVLCPRANAMLGVGMPRIKEIFENASVAFGTDNVMVNSLNMFREMEFAFKAARGLSRDYKFDARKILEAATLNGRKILGLKSSAIREGNEANFIILGNRKYLYDPILAIVHRYEASDIRSVVRGVYV